MAGLDDISVSNYTVLQYSTDDFATAGTTVTNVQSIGELTDEKTIIDVQQYGVAYLRKLVGTANAGPMDVVVNFDPSDVTHQYLLTSYTNGTQEKFRLVMNNAAGDKGNYVEFDGLVASKTQGNEFDSARTLTFSIAIDGALGPLTDNV